MRFLSDMLFANVTNYKTAGIQLSKIPFILNFNCIFSIKELSAPQFHADIASGFSKPNIKYFMCPLTNLLLTHGFILERKKD